LLRSIAAKQRTKQAEEHAVAAAARAVAAVAALATATRAATRQEWQPAGEVHIRKSCTREDEGLNLCSSIELSFCCHALLNSCSSNLLFLEEALHSVQGK
jgi:hypothetical protein